jgi:hypothetical protein
MRLNTWIRIDLEIEIEIVEGGGKEGKKLGLDLEVEWEGSLIPYLR